MKHKAGLSSKNAALIAVSPFLFGFYRYAPNVWLPHLISGVVVILLVLVSQPEPNTTVTHKKLRQRKKWGFLAEDTAK